MDRWAGNPYDLSDKQLAIVRLISNGYEDKQIAEYLGLSLQGVKYHLPYIRRKMDVCNRFEIISVWIREQEYGDYRDESNVRSVAG